MSRGVNLIRTVALAVCVLAAVPALAEVTRIDVQHRTDALGGRAFGDAGPYEILTGTIHFAVDPANEHNRVIVDVDKAPRNAQGRVEFSSDLVVLKPKDPAKGNGVLFFDVVNRGNKGLLQVFSRASRGTDFTNEAEFGDAWLLTQGVIDEPLRLRPQNLHGRLLRLHDQSAILLSSNCSSAEYPREAIPGDIVSGIVVLRTACIST